MMVQRQGGGEVQRWLRWRCCSLGAQPGPAHRRWYGRRPAGIRAPSRRMAASCTWARAPIFRARGFQVRRASDGALLKTITLPAASQSYDKSAFSPDKQFVAISLVDSNGVTKIELWSLSTGSLVPGEYTTDAVRNIRGLDISSNSGLVASMERFAYGGGGMLRVFRTSDGALVLKHSARI